MILLCVYVGLVWPKIPPPYFGTSLFVTCWGIKSLSFFSFFFLFFFFTFLFHMCLWCLIGLLRFFKDFVFVFFLLNKLKSSLKKTEVITLYSLRFEGMTFHPKLEKKKKHFPPLTFICSNFVKLILKMLCTNLPFT